MAEPYIGEIRVFGFPFAPYRWAECNGQLMPITQNQQLFAIIGNRYGGDGKTNFGLPNLQDGAAISQGQGQGLSSYKVGDKGGTTEITLSEREMPMHSHQPQATTEPADIQAPAPDRPLARSTPGYAYQGEISKDLVPMSSQAAAPAGKGAAHNNMPPSQVLRYCISLDGVFPNRDE